MYMLCRHIKPDGIRCGSPALLNKPYCYFHDHYLREAGKSLKKGKAKKPPIALPRLINRRTVLEALSDVIGALGAGHLDASTAARLIYGLQVAGQFAEQYAPSHTPNPIQSFTVTEDGAEIAEEWTICEDDDRCEDCEDAATCHLARAVKFRAAHPEKFPANKDDQDNEDSAGDDNDNDDDDEEEDDE